MASAEAAIRKVEEGPCERAGVDVWVLRWRVGELNRSRTLARRSSFAPRQRHSERLPASLEINNSIEAATFGQLVRRYLQEAIPERQFTAGPLSITRKRSSGCTRSRFTDLCRTRTPESSVRKRRRPRSKRCSLLLRAPLLRGRRSRRIARAVEALGLLSLRDFTFRIISDGYPPNRPQVRTYFNCWKARPTSSFPYSIQLRDACTDRSEQRHAVDPRIRPTCLLDWLLRV